MLKEKVGKIMLWQKIKSFAICKNKKTKKKQKKNKQIHEIKVSYRLFEIWVLSHHLTFLQLYKGHLGSNSH